MIKTRKISVKYEVCDLCQIEKDIPGVEEDGKWFCSHHCHYYYLYPTSTDYLIALKKQREPVVYDTGSKRNEDMGIAFDQGSGGKGR